IDAYTFAKEYYCTNETLRNQLQGTMYDTLNNLGCLNESTNIKGSFSFPLDEQAGFFDCGTPDYIVYGMTEASYPTATVEDVSIPVPNDTIGRTYVDVYYWENGSFPATPKNVILGTIDVWLDDWYYFVREDCKDSSYLTVGESFQDCTNTWITNREGWSRTLWAKPKEKVNVFAVKFVSDDMYRIQHSTNDPMGDLTEFQYSNTLNLTTEQQYVSLKDLVSFYSTEPDGHNGSNLDLGWKDAKIYKVYDFGKDRLVESQFSEPVAPNELKNLKDGDTIYLVKPYVILNKVSNGSGTSLGSIEVFGFHNGSNETVSLYDMPEFESVNWYKDASLAADKKWTKAELKARLDAEVFFEQNVIIHDATNDAGTKKSYDEFMDMIKTGTYYSNPDSKGSKITEDKGLQGFGADLHVYRNLSDIGKNILLHVHGINDDYDYVLYDVNTILNYFIGQNHYTVYADASYTQKLETREQFEVLDFEADVYARLEGNYAKSFSVVRDNGSDTMSYAELYQAVSNPNSA
ncbi:MAG: hypothetical protein J6W76_02165, partial [Spirochaetales bacterium]|nr:hypothetical protein [Spirochaetales bacterium]